MHYSPIPHNWKPLPEKVKLCICRFPFGFQEHSHCVEWMLKAIWDLKDHPRVGQLETYTVNDTPVDMSRNRAMKYCLDKGFDFALFLDADMAPDYMLKDMPISESNQPFLPNALEFAMSHDGPCVIGAPYCSSPPEEHVLVSKWSSRQTDEHNEEYFLTKFGRDECVDRIGFEKVASLATGVMLTDLRCLEQLPKPWFSYQFTDEFQSEKSSTEDTVFTRNLHLIGVPQYVYWSAWAGHWKAKLVPKPRLIPLNAIPHGMKERLRRHWNSELDLQYGEVLKIANLLKKYGITKEEVGELIVNRESAKKAAITEAAEMPAPITERMNGKHSPQLTGANA